MKIAFIGGRDIHKIGGIESYMYNLCTELVKLGHEPIVFCENDHDGEEEVNGFRVVNIKAEGAGLMVKPKVGFKAINYCLKHFPDYKVYHFNAFGSGMFGFWARLHNRKTIIQLHGIESRRTKWTKNQRSLIEFLELSVTGFSVKHCTSVSLEQVELINKKFPFKNCRYIPTAVYLPPPTKPTDVLERFGLEKNKYFLYLGRLVQDKNPDYLIRAFNESKISDYKLVIVGNNDANPEYVNHLHDLAKDNPNIVFTGVLYGNEKDVILEKSYAFCIPSTIEGLSIALLEAMSYSKPVIASDIPANKEGLGELGIWVKAEDINTLKDALNYAVSHPDELKDMGIKARKRVENLFTWQIVARQYHDFVTSL